MNEESSSEKSGIVNQVSKEDLNNSAKHTNNRIDKLDIHMIAMVDKMGTLIEAQIRTEERDTRNAETLARLESNQIDLGKTQKTYTTNNDIRFAELEKLVLTLEHDKKHEKEVNEKAEKNKDARKNAIIAALVIMVIIALIKIVVPFL